MVTRGSLVESGMFDVAHLKLLVEQHESGVSDHSSAIWSLMMFDAFLRNTHGRAEAIGDIIGRRQSAVAR
jgi:asparagine synthase (glutamine-hydrolysing)